MTQQTLLQKIAECQFICIELQLYLDTHPNDEAAKNDYLCYAQKLQQLLEEYEALYGPLLNFGLSSTDTGCWVCSKWPWEE